MPSDKLRQQIVFEAARLMYQRRETEYYRAKMKAARKICRGWIKPSDLPSNREIRDEILRFSHVYDGESRDETLFEMRREALRLMRRLKRFRPKLIGSTLTGHIRTGSDIDIHVFAANIESVTAVLEEDALPYEVEQKRVRKNNEERIYTHVHVQDRFPIELTIYPPDKVGFVFKSSVTGKAMERASLPELEELMRRDYPGADLSEEGVEADCLTDRFQVYRALLLPLAHVRGGRKHHPEGDVLYHSLQVYDLVRSERPYDEELLLAALLHDVGKGIDPHDHVRAGLQALDGFVTERTAWFIQFHMEAHKLREGTLGNRARRRLLQSEDFDELMLLEECDRLGRQSGVEVPDVDDALEEIREISRQYG